ncbi:putative transposase [Pantoea sesami]|nr:putative transposase [Pantoea sesami]
MEASDIKKMKDLEDENRRLKKIFADLSLECLALKDVIEKSFNTSDKAGARQLSDGTICHEHPPGVQDIIAEQDGVFLSARHLA